MTRYWQFSAACMAIALCGAARLAVRASSPVPMQASAATIIPPATETASSTTDRSQSPRASLLPADASVELIRDGDANPEPSTLAAGFHRSHAVWMEVTAYCACPKCCGPNAKGLTASGAPVTYNLGRFVAADTSVLPFGSRVRIPGYHNGEPVPVLDRGGAIKGYHLDVFFPSHQQALDWGRRWVVVEIE